MKKTTRLVVIKRECMFHNQTSLLGAEVICESQPQTSGFLVAVKEEGSSIST